MRYLKSCLSAAVLLCASAAYAQTSWTNGNNTGLWSDVLNWDNGVPQFPSQVAVINQSGALVTLDSSLTNATIDSLQLGQNNPGTLTITNSNLVLQPATPSVSPLTMGAGTVLNVLSPSSSAQLVFSLGGASSTYTATADPTAQINVTGASSVFSIVGDGVNTGSTLNLTGGGTLSLASGATLSGDSTTNLTTDFTLHLDGTIQGLGMTLNGALDTPGSKSTIAPSAAGFTIGAGGSITTGSGDLLLDSASYGGAFTNNGTIEAGYGFLNLHGLSNNISSASLINNSSVIVDSGGYFGVKSVDGSPVILQNNGTISLNGSDLDQFDTQLEFKGSNTSFYLNGTGSLNMTDSMYNEVDGLSGSETLVNGAGHTIQGAGTIWDLNLINNGTINANTAVNPLVISANGANNVPTAAGFTNNAALNVTGSAYPTMTIDTTFGGFQNSSTGTVTVASGSTLLFGSAGAGGALVNDGSIVVNGAIGFDSYSGTFNLSGSGTLQLNGGSLYPQTGSETLVNGAGHTIVADGGVIAIDTINNGTIETAAGGLTIEHVVLTNNGTLDVNNGTLTFDPDARTGFVNNGTVNSSQDIEVALAGDKTIVNNGQITFSGGNLVFAAGGSSNVTLNGTGTLALGSGNIEVASGNVSLTIGAGQTVSGGGTIYPTLTNNGILLANGTTPLTVLNLTNYNPTTGTLSGGGYATSGQALIIQNLGPIQTIAAGTTVSLSGGAGAILTADGTTDALTSLVTNAGTLQLGAGHSLTLDHSSATYSNPGTLIVGAGSTFDASSRQFLSLDTGGTLSGQYTINGTFAYTAQNGSADSFIHGIGAGSSVSLGTDGLITFDGSTNALSQLSSNAGTLAITDQTLTLSNIATFDNSGTLTLNHATLDTRAGTFNQYNAGHLTGGTYNILNGSTFYFSPAGGGSGDITTIDAGASVMLDGTGTMAYGSGGTDALTHLSDIEGSFALSGSRTITLDPSVTTFTNNGTLLLANDAIFNTNNAAFQNLSGGQLTGGTYVIGGTFQYAPPGGEAGITSIGANTSLTLAGSGTIVYGPSATNALTGLATNNGTFNLDAVTGGFNLAGGFDNEGTMALTNQSGFTAGGAFTNGGSVTLSNASTLTAAGYTGSAASTLTINDTSVADFRGGAFSNISGNTLSNGTFNVAGTLVYDGSAGEIDTIGATASVTLSGSGSIQYGSVGGPTVNALTNLTENDGIFNMNGGANVYLTPSFFTNAGHIALSDTGTSLITGGFYNTGAASLSGGASMVAQGPLINIGSITLDGPNTKFEAFGALFSPTGSLTLLNGATADLRAGYTSYFGQNTDTFYNLSSGVLQGGTYYIAGNLLIDEESDPSTGYPVGGNIYDIGGGTTLTMAANGQILYGPGDGTNALASLAENDGTFNVVQSAIVGTSSDFVNWGDMAVETGGLFGTAGNFDNESNVNIDSTSSVFAGNYYQNDGTTEVNGSLYAEVTVNGGTLDGTGTVNGDVTVASGGTVEPGDDPGVLTINGNYTQQAGTYLDINFEDLSLWGQLMVSGTADLNGIIDVSLLGPINFSVGEVFEILSASSVINDGVTFALPPLGIGLEFEPVFQTGELDLAVVATPEPGTWVLLAGSLLLIGGFRRRRAL